MNFDIIGAGIGGLTTAIALEQKEIESRVFEQTKAIKPIGAGIVLANNAMQVFDKLGLRDQIEESGNPISTIRITDNQLHRISEINLQYFERKYGVKNIAIHRGKLQEILVGKISEKNLYLGHKLENIKEQNDVLEIHFKDKPIYTSKYILGADGLNSIVRKSLFNENTIRETRQICWRGVTEFALPGKYRNELNEAWGKGDRFGFVQIAPNKVYWYALKSFKRSQKEYSIQELNHYFKDYHPTIKEIVRITPIKSIHTSIISDLKPIKKWHMRNACLIGDAAHATTPNMGQGACQCIEDAFVISECLNKFEVNKAFDEYQKLRLSKAHEVVNASWTLGKLAHWKNPVAIRLRNQIMEMIPEKMSRQKSKKIFELAQI